MTAALKVVCMREPDRTVWKDLAASLRRDGWDSLFASGLPHHNRTSIHLDTERANVTFNVGLRENDTSFVRERWPDHLRARLEAREVCIDLLPGGPDGEAFRRAAATYLAVALDGWIFEAATERMLDAHGECLGTSIPYEPPPETVDADPEVSIDWSQLPHASLRPFTIVVRCDAVPSLYDLDDLLESFEHDLVRVGSRSSTGALPNSSRWRDASFVGTRGHRIAFMRATRGGAYVRITFDVYEQLLPRDRDGMAEVVDLAQRVIDTLREHHATVPIDVEP